MDENEFRAGLIRNYPTLEKMAEALDYRIEEAVDLRDQLAEEREKKADATLLARIAELESQLAAVNARLTRALNPRYTPVG